jgi:cytochrome c2
MEAGANGVGPTLHGVVGRTVGTEAGYAFSDAMKDHGGNWDLVTLSEFLAAPKTVVPGTKMGFAGLPKPEDRVNLIVYLNQASGAPVELTAPSSGAAAPADSDAAASDTAATDSAATDSAATDSAATDSAATQGTATTETAPATTEMAAADATDAMAAGDAEAGETVYKKCKACHSTEAGENKVGPTLHGIVGRAVGAEAGYNYSDAMKTHGGEWTPEKLSAFLENPKGDVPGTKMTFPGLKKPEDRANVIAYLKSRGGS